MIKKIICILVFTVIYFGFYTSNLFGQKLKKKSLENGYITVNFNIDKKTKLKEGLFLKYNNKTNDTICFGNYQQGKRVGKWNHFDGNLKYTYNYDNEEFVLIDSLVNPDNEFYIKMGNRYSLTTVDRPALYMDSEEDLKYQILKNVKLSDEIYKNYLEDYSVVSIAVDSLGNYRFLNIEKSFLKSFDKEIVNGIENLPNNFLPAIKDGKPVESKMFIVFNVAHESTKLKIKSSRYRIVIDYIYYLAPVNVTPLDNSTLLKYL